MYLHFLSHLNTWNGMGTSIHYSWETRTPNNTHLTSSKDQEIYNDAVLYNVSNNQTSPEVGVTKPISSVPLFSWFFSTLNIMLIFDRCCHSLAAVTPLKYECDEKNLTGTFARLKILLMNFRWSLIVNQIFFLSIMYINLENPSTSIPA